MIDLHIHTLLSDGILLPSEVARYGETKGYSYLALTDHVDISNIDFVIPRLIKACENLSKSNKIKLIPGVELTHIPPETFEEMTTYARSLGVKIIIAHGETLVEPVSKGTNKKAIEAKVDILAHPGLICEEEVKLAKKNGVYLEITSRKGHSLSNGHVAFLAKKIKAKLVLNSDAHLPHDFLESEKREKILLGAGIEDLKEIFTNSFELVERIKKTS